MYSENSQLKSPPIQPKSDIEIALAVEEALSIFTRNGGHKIIANVLDGVVTLQGTVSSYELRRSISNAARDLPGIEGIRNYISVCPASQSF